MRISTIEREGHRYTARGALGEVVWTTELELGTAGASFHDHAVWPAASAVVIGGGSHVHLVSEAATITTIDLGDDFFGYAVVQSETLYILGWRHVTAVDRSLAISWVRRDVAVDGITWVDGDDERIRLSAELDPPGGWVDVELATADGRTVGEKRPHSDSY